MGLRFIYGRAGTGKSEFCFNEIKKHVENNERVFIITPEQFSYSAEKKLMEALSGASINAEVISFKRMANRVFTEVGGLNDILISKSGRAMLIYSILEKEKRDLLFLNNSNDNIDLVLREITELKKHGITSQKIEDFNCKTEDTMLKAKLKEINYIYKIYEENMKSKFIDEEDLLTKLNEKILQSKLFDNAVIYIDEFAGFTEQEYNIVTQIIKKAQQVNVTICADNLEEDTDKENDIFYFNKQFAKLLTKCAQNVDKKVEKPIALSSTYRLKNETLKHLEANIYNNRYKKFLLDNQDINLFLANTPYTEVENIAKEINMLVKNQGYRYNQIAIITKGIENLQDILKAIFSKYEIPVFIDSKAEVTENILIKYVLSILEIFTSNWNTESVLNYIKSGFVDISSDDVYLIENFCRRMGINRNRWYKCEWREYEDLRIKIVEPLLNLKAEIDNHKNAKGICKAIYMFLREKAIEEKLNIKIQNLINIGVSEKVDEYKNSINILVEVLDEIVEFFGDEKISLDMYKEILKIGLQNRKFGRIPQNIDQVILGDVDRTRSHKVEVVFIMGVNDGIFPSVNKSQGFLNDKDRKILKESNLEIAKGTLDNLFEEQFNIYKALTTAEKKLYLSYSSSNKEGAALRPSVIISKIKKIFPNIKEESDIIREKSAITNEKATFEELLRNIRKYKNGEEIDAIWGDVYNWFLKNDDWKEKLIFSLEGLDYSNKAETINKSNIEKLYGNVLKTSISRLEQYRRCPFSFHLKYGLKIKEQEEYKLNAIDTGSFMHEVLDTFFERIDNICIEDEEREKIIEDIIDEKLKLKKNYIFSSSPKFIMLTNRLKKTIKESIKYIIEQMRTSDFKIVGHEVEFSKKMDNIEVIGKIDRIDIGENGNEEYIRIIDYKSSEKNIDLNQMMAGTQIQLLTYIDALSEKQNKKPAGVLYFNLIEPIINESKDLSDEVIKDKIRKSFKMNGLILADIKIVKMMDKTLEKGSSDIIPVYLDKEGNISQSRSSTVTTAQFTSLQKATKKIIKQISNEILSGNIDIKPMYDKAKKTSSCKYCEYKTICAFNSKINKYEYLQNKTKEIILEQLKEGNEF